MRAGQIASVGRFRLLKIHAGAVLALGFMVIHGFDVQTYPLVNHDLVFLNDAGLQLVNSGHFRADVLSQNPGFENRYLWQPPGLALTSALSYWLFGFGIWQTRLFSMVFGALGVWAVFELVRSVRPTGVGALIAAVSLFFFPPWVLTAKDSRMDTGAILALLIATQLVLKILAQGDRARTLEIILAGLCVSVAGVFHTASVTWALALLILIAIFSRERFRISLAYSVGAGILVTAWLLYGLQELTAFKQQYLALLADRASQESLGERLVGEILRYLGTFSKLPTFYVISLIAAHGLVAYALWKDFRTRVLLVLAGLVLILNALVVGGRSSGFYNLYPLVLVFCLIGIGIEECLLRWREARRRWMTVATILCLAAFVLNIAGVSVGPRLIAFWYQGPQRNYAAQMTPLSKLLRPGDQVWGVAPIWFAVVEAGGRLNASEWVPPWKQTRPDPHRHKFVVTDRHVPFNGSQDYRKIGEFGSKLPVVMGASFSNKSYSFDLWQSKFID